MPWIENVSLENIIKGFHFFEEHKTILIRIKEFDAKFEPVKFAVMKTENNIVSGLAY